MSYKEIISLVNVAILLCSHIHKADRAVPCGITVATKSEYGTVNLEE